MRLENYFSKEPPIVLESVTEFRVCNQLKIEQKL